MFCSISIFYTIKFFITNSLVLKKIENCEQDLHLNVKDLPFMNQLKSFFMMFLISMCHWYIEACKHGKIDTKGNLLC